MTAWFPIVLTLTILVRLAFGFLELEYGSQAQTIVTENVMLIAIVLAWIISLCVDIINSFVCFAKKGK